MLNLNISAEFFAIVVSDGAQIFKRNLGPAKNVRNQIYLFLDTEAFNALVRPRPGPWWRS